MNVKESWAGAERLGHKIWYQAMDHSGGLLLHCAHYRTSTVRESGLQHECKSDLDTPAMHGKVQ